MPAQRDFTPTMADISGALRADGTETSVNPRSRSAVMRVAEMLPLEAAA
jgi:16S rRNA (cytosine1402-N4)-methyltransferase